MNLKDASALALETAAAIQADARQIVDRKQSAVWLSQGEDMAFIAANLPAELGAWYCRGVDDFGAATVIRLLEENVLQNGPEFPWLAQVKLHTIQNYAAVVRAIERDPRLAEYDFWHVEAVLGVLGGKKRLELLDAGRQEQMSIGKFRRYRDETLGTAKELPARSEAQVNGQNEQLYYANRDLTDAVTGYAVDLAVANQQIETMQVKLGKERSDRATTQQRCEDLQLALLLAQAEAENAEGEATELRARLATPEMREDEVIASVGGADEHPPTEYRQKARREWVDGDNTCPKCGGRLVCRRCGE